MGRRIATGNMAPKRGMSLEDKRSTILNIFHESRDVFVLKVRVARSRIVAPRSLQAGCPTVRRQLAAGTLQPLAGPRV